MAQVMINFRMDEDLKKALADAKAARNMTEHELIEEEKDD